jgi:hypothetical protein
MTTPGTPSISAELAAVRGELGRIDAKCATLAGLAGAAAAFLATQAPTRSPMPVRILLAAAGVAMVVLFASHGTSCSGVRAPPGSGTGRCSRASAPPATAPLPCRPCACEPVRC